MAETNNTDQSRSTGTSFGSAFGDALKTKGNKIALIASVVALIVGFAAWMVLLNVGLLGTTGLSNPFTWGLAIAVFAFLVGFGAGSQFVACYIVLANKTDLMQYVKAAQAIALAGGVGAGVAIMTDLGDPYHIISMFIGSNVGSPMVWDMAALSCFIVVAFINLILLARNSKAIKVWMIIAGIVALALQIIEGLLFALIEARMWWHSVVMPIDFLAVAVVCGLAIAVLYCAFNNKEYSDSAIKTLGKGLIIAIAVHLVLAIIDLIIVVVHGNAASAATLAVLGSVWPLYVLELGLPLAAIFVLAKGMKAKDGNASARIRKFSIISGILVVVGIFCHRLMLMYPAFGSPTLFVPLSNAPSPAWPLPVSTGLYTSIGSAFEVTQGYLPGFIEWLTVLLPVGLAVLIFVLGVAFVRAMLKKD